MKLLSHISPVPSRISNAPIHGEAPAEYKLRLMRKVPSVLPRIFPLGGVNDVTFHTPDQSQSLTFSAEAASSLPGCNQSSQVVKLVWLSRSRSRSEEPLQYKYRAT